MVVFTICFLGLVAYLKDSTKADPDLSFYGRSSEDKGGLKVLFSHSFYDFSLYLTMLGKKKNSPLTHHTEQGSQDTWVVVPASPH